MIKFVSLFSGSSGNSYFVQVDDNKFLVDVGVSKNRIVTELEKIGENIKDIDAIFITHEHIDHIRGLSLINKHYNIPIHINKKTLDEVNNKIKELNINSISLFEKKEYNFKETTVKPFSISHDAVDPVGFSFFDKENNKITIATDLGEVTKEVYNNLQNSDILVLEANYDDNLIHYSPYPRYVVNRIISKDGHLSNLESTELVSDLIEEGLKNIALGHISKSNNNYELIPDILNEKLLLKNIETKNINLEILRCDESSNELLIK